MAAADRAGAGIEPPPAPSETAQRLGLLPMNLFAWPTPSASGTENRELNDGGFARRPHDNRSLRLQSLTRGRTVNNTQPYVHSAPISAASRMLAIIGAALLGVILIGGVGFAGMPAFHDATHDVRHTLSFPCH
jgi:cobalt transporter subunit CbtB